MLICRLSARKQCKKLLKQGLIGIALEADHTLVINVTEIVRYADAASSFHHSSLHPKELCRMKKADSRQTQSERRPLLYFVACEPSGDQLGAKLITALASCATQKGQACPHLAGMGGPLMQACGLKSVLPFETFAIMGFFELFPRLPKLWSGLHFLTEDIVKRSPDILLTIDAPGLALRLAKRVRRRLGKKILIVHYVAPSVWAWKQVPSPSYGRVL